MKIRRRLLLRLRRRREAAVNGRLDRLVTPLAMKEEEASEARHGGLLARRLAAWPPRHLAPSLSPLSLLTVQMSTERYQAERRDNV